SVALVGAAESLADWWLDHPDVSPGNLASYLMNLTWLGFNDLIAGAVWRPSGGTASTSCRSRQSGTTVSTQAPPNGIGCRAVIVPSRWGFGLRAFHNSNAHSLPEAASPVRHVVNAAFAGNRTGSLNRTSIVNAPGRSPSNEARACALLHMPCAIALGKPN